MYLEVLRRCWLAVWLSEFEEHDDEVKLSQDGGQTEHHQQEGQPGPGGLGGQGGDVVAKDEQVNGAVAESLDNVIFGEKFDKISQLEIEAGEETDGEEVIEQGVAEDNPRHNKVGSGQSHNQNPILVVLTDDMVGTEDDDQHVDAVEDVHQLAEGRHVEDINVDISREKRSFFL